VFADDIYPDKRTASYTMMLTAEGESAAGCATSGAGSALWLLLGLPLIWRRRRR